MIEINGKHLRWDTIFKIMKKLGYEPNQIAKKHMKRLGKRYAYKLIMNLILKQKKKTEKLSNLKNAMSILYWQGVFYGEIKDFKEFKRKLIEPFLKSE